MDLKAGLLHLMQSACTDELEFAARMRKLQPDPPSTPDHWSTKDNLAHCAHWQAHLADNLQAIREGNPPQRVEDLHPANDAVYQAHRTDTWEEVLEFLQHSYWRLVEDTQSFSEAELNSCEFFPWQSNRPLWRTIAGYTVLHPYSHLAGALAQFGQSERILANYQALLPKLLAMDKAPAWQGSVYYDLACFCALAGTKESALQALATAFALAPELREWSQQDSDLESLRDDPDFQALLLPAD